MNSFSYYNPTRIIFGQDSIKHLKKHVSSLGKTILLHYGMNSIKKNGIYDTVIAALQEASVQYYELGGVRPNPTYDLVAQGIALCQEKNIDAVLAVGGGSVIDSAKAIAAGALYDGDLEAAYMSNASIKQALPIGVVLTIPAAGSESSTSSVVTVRNGQHKRSIRGESIVPKFAIINPAYFATLNQYQTACGISDIFSHLLERYFTHTTHVDYTDRLLESSMKSLIHYGPYVMHHLDDVDARSELGFIGTLAHNGLLGSGRIEEWSSHRIEHELSSAYDIAHGAGLAIIFPAWMKHVYPENKTRFVQFAQRVFSVDYALENTDLIIEEGIARYEEFLKKMFLPVRLHEAGIFDDRFDEMITNLFVDRPSTFGNFKSLDAEDVLAIFEKAK